MSRSMRMLALALLSACKVHAPPNACAHVTLGACVEPPAPLSPCERGRARDLDDSSCMTTRETRDLARHAGVYVDDNDVIECETKTDELVAAARLAKIGCLPRHPPPPPCPARTVRSGEACLPLEEKGGAVDVATWSRAAASEICSRLLRSPFAIERPETEATLTVELATSIPNNDLTLGFVRAKTKPAVAELDLGRAVAAVDDALRQLGGTASGTASATDVSGAATCRTSSRRPISVP